MYNTHSLCSYSQNFSREAPQHLLLLCKCKSILGAGCSIVQLFSGLSEAGPTRSCIWELTQQELRKEPGPSH